MTTAHHPQDPHPNVPHPATATEAPNGEGTVDTPITGDTLDRPIMDGASEYYGPDAGVEVPAEDPDDNA